MEAARPLYQSRQPGFASTHWSAIRACAGDDASAHAARSALCQAYWYPVYAYVRRQNHDTHHAEDLTQDFFAHILQRRWFQSPDQSKGRFRTFLLAAVEHFLRDQFRRRAARKRGGGYQHIPHDLRGVETGPENGALTVHPAEIYEVEWASALVAGALRQLEEEYAAAGKQHQYQCLKPYLMTLGEAAHYDATSTDLGVTVQNVRVMVHRLRSRYRQILKERVAQTVASPDEVDAELRHLRVILASC